MPIKLVLASKDNLPAQATPYLKEEGGAVFLELPDKQLDDVAPLITARDHEKAEKSRVIIERDALKTQVSTLEATLKGSGGDALRQVESAWQTRFDDTKRNLESQLERKTAVIKKTLVGQTATALATKVSKAPALLKPALESRLTVLEDGDNYTVRVLESDGKMSAKTIDDLEKEVVADPQYAAIIIGSQASGGGAGPGGAPSAGGKKFSEMTEKERIDLHKTNVVEYRRLRDLEKAAQND